MYNDIEPNGSSIHLGSTARPFEGIVTKKISSTGVIHGGGSSGDAFQVDDDTFLVDINQANRLSLQGMQNRTQAGIQFGSGGPYVYLDSNVMRVDTNWVVDGYLVIGSLQSGTNYGPLYRNNYGQISYNVSSERYKDNIVVAEDCSWIYALRPMTFEWKNGERAKAESTQLGLTAEVHKLYPQLTWLDKEGKPEGVHYEWLAVPLLIELKKLRKGFNELKTKLSAQA